MKNTAIVIMTIIAMSAPAFAGQTQVKGYTRQDGTYVQGYTRSTPDSMRSNNLGSRSNGGTQRDEYNGGATNKKNSSYGMYDNDSDGRPNSIDIYPEDKDK